MVVQAAAGAAAGSGGREHPRLQFHAVSGMTMRHSAGLPGHQAARCLQQPRERAARGPPRVLGACKLMQPV